MDLTKLQQPKFFFESTPDCISPDLEHKLTDVSFNLSLICQGLR